MNFCSRLFDSFGHPAHPILLFDLCRGIELVYAIERAIELLDAAAGQGRPASLPTPRETARAGAWWKPRAVRSSITM